MYRLSISCLFLLHCFTLNAAEDAGVVDIKASVVKLSITQRNPDFNRPWNKSNPSEVSGTGFSDDVEDVWNDGKPK
jgi:hypothetical protein